VARAVCWRTRRARTIAGTAAVGASSRGETDERTTTTGRRKRLFEKNPVLRTSDAPKENDDEDFTSNDVSSSLTSGVALDVLAEHRDVPRRAGHGTSDVCFKNRPVRRGCAFR
jgi:hypothetical protein